MFEVSTMATENSSSFQLQRCLGAENKVERKKGYQKLLEFLIKQDLSLDEVWREYGDILFKGIEDESEGAREASLQALLHLSRHGNEGDWSPFFLILRRKEEPSEEVRLLRVSILHKLFERESVLKVFGEDFLSCLPSALSDPYHEIRIEGCTLLRLISPCIEDSLLKKSITQILPPLLSNFTHVQKNVREAALKALPSLIIGVQNCQDEFGESDVIMAQRCFDPSPRVRLALSQASAVLLKDWRHNQSRHLRILLLLLSQYDDEVPEVREMTVGLWKELAELWIKREIKCSSNGEALKDKMDFPIELLHYPPNVSRPSFPCREYLSRYFHQILPATWMDLRDWRVETRVKTSQLIYICFLHMENKLTEHSVKILETLEHGAKDNEPEVIKNLERASQYFGCFVDSKVWLPIIIQRLTSLDADSKTTLLRILSFIIKGSDPKLLSLVLTELGNIISNEDVSYSYKADHLQCLLGCIEELILVCGKSNSIIQHQIFKCLLVSIALSQSYEMKERGRNLLNQLVMVVELPGGTKELFALESGHLLEAYCEKCNEWNESSFECLIFGTLLQESPSTIEHYSDPIFKIFHTVLDPTREHLYKLKLQFYIYLSKQISSSTLHDSDDILKKYSLKLINEIITPALKWSSGKKAEAVRSAAAATLLSVFEIKALCPQDIDFLISSDLFSRMNSLLEDNSIKTRLFIVKTYGKAFKLGRNVFQAHQVVKIMTFLVQRLNDQNNEVRLESLRSIEAADECLDPEVTDSTYTKELEKFYENIAIHMDDELSDIRSAVCDLLKKLSHRDPQLMQCILKNAASQHKHKEECFVVIQHIETLSI